MKWVPVFIYHILFIQRECVPGMNRGRRVQNDFASYFPHYYSRQNPSGVFPAFCSSFVFFAFPGKGQTVVGHCILRVAPPEAATHFQL